MNTSLYEDGFNDAIKVYVKEIKAWEKEIIMLKQGLVNNLRSKGFSDEEINNLTEFSLDYIKSI